MQEVSTRVGRSPLNMEDLGSVGHAHSVTCSVASSHRPLALNKILYVRALEQAAHGPELASHSKAAGCKQPSVGRTHPQRRSGVTRFDAASSSARRQWMLCSTARSTCACSSDCSTTYVQSEQREDLWPTSRTLCRCQQSLCNLARKCRQRNIINSLCSMLEQGK